MPGKKARSDPRASVRVTRGAGSGQHLASVLQEGRENANIDVGLGFIWRISVIEDRGHRGNDLRHLLLTHKRRTGAKAPRRAALPPSSPGRRPMRAHIVGEDLADWRRAALLIRNAGVSGSPSPKPSGAQNGFLSSTVRGPRSDG
jgi:hypothetical protein